MTCPTGTFRLLNMKVNTTTKVIKTTISLTKDEAVKRVTESFLDILSDSILDGIDTGIEQAESLARVLKMIKEDRWVQLFSEGWTALVLSSEAMDALEAHCTDDDGDECDNNSLLIQILNNSGDIVTIITEDYISY